MRSEKKSNSVFLVIIIILLVLVLGGMWYFYYKVNVANRKEPITADAFKEYMNTKGFAIYDTESEETKKVISKDFFDAIKKGYVTENNDSSDFRINFFELKDMNHTMYYFYEVIISTETNNKGEFNETYEEGDNYLKYTALTNGYYLVTTRVDNTIFYGKIKKENRDDLDKILNDLNY